ncbi:MAG: NF038122 family metalloprotease [Cyanobacteria bacterium J06621_11]
MVKFNLTYGHNISLEQRVVFEVAARILSTFVTDDTSVDVHVLGASGLNDGKAVGGAVPLFHKVHYGVLKQYLEQDASSYIDEQSVLHMQDGNTVDLSAYGDVINGSTEILLTRAQAEALGMDESLLLADNSTWERDTIDTAGLDGYLVVNQDFEWNNDVLRLNEATEGTLDTLSMAIHELTHVMGFVSGIDGTININELLSGELSVEGTTLFDLRRFTATSAELENPDGSVSSITEGEAAYLSADGGKTILGELSTGQNKDIGGDGYQASHWKRMQVAMGIMDPTLAYKEQLSLSERDLQALDLLGWDVDYAQLNHDLDIESLLIEAEQAVATSFGLDSHVLTEHRAAGNIYTMGFSEWWQLFEKQIIEMGFSEWWQVLETGYDSWETFQEDPDAMLQMGFSEWWQSFEVTVLNMGFSEWWQTFESDMLNMGFSEWWQLLEMGFSEWWQQIDTYFSTLDESGFSSEGGSGQNVIEGNSANESVVVSGGDADDILAGSRFRDLISGGGGDDLIDGKAGNDSLLGDTGNDILYGLDGDDQLYGGDGDDFLAGEADNDKLYGEAGHDILSGGFGNDLLEGNADNDILKGDAGNDVVDGGEGNDDVGGGDGSDIVVGGRGEDAVSGGRGDDVVYGDRYFTPEEKKDSGAEQLELEHISEQAGFTAVGEQPPVDFWVRMEAEDFKLRNFNIEEQAIASGDEVIATGGRGEAKSTFTGPTGVYDIIVGYYDEKDGKGEIEVEIGKGRDKTKVEWTLEEDFDNEDVGTNNFITRTIRDVELKSGDELKIKGDSDADEFIRLDYIDIISTTESNALANGEFYNGSLYIESQFDKAEETIVEAAELGGSLVVEDQENAEAYWLDNVFGTTKGIIKINVGDSRFNLVQDKVTRSENVTLRIEAEDFDLSGGYKVENRNDYASGNAAIESSGRGTGKASTVFTGEAGIYDIFVSYIDEGDKSASAAFGINGQTLDQWSFDADSKSAEYRAVSSYVSLNTGDSINLEGRADGDEKALIDYVDFVKVNDSNSSDSLMTSQLSEVFIEAEDLSWHGGKAKSKSKDYASDRTLIEVEKSSSATATFSGETGLYTILIGYTDEKGEGQLSARLGDSSLGSWQLHQSRDVVTTQTLAAEIFINSGNQLTLNTGEKKFQLDYINFIPVFEQSEEVKSSAEITSSVGQEIYIEAEQMERSSKTKIEDKDFASNGSYIKLEGDDKNNATATTLFQGETGYYDVIVGYYDGNKGTAELTVQLDGENLDRWQLDQDLGDKAASEQTFVTRTVASGVKLTRADSVLQIIGEKDGDDKGFVDYVKLVRVAAPDDAATNSDKSTSSDIIRGGQGNDTVYGGEGNDLIYGEDEFDNGLELASNSSDTLYGGSGNDRIFGNSGNDTLYGDDDSPSEALIDGAVAYNGKQYILTDSQLSWQAAQNVATALGGNLVTINNAAEEQWLRSQFGGSESFWLGLNDQTTEGTFEWASGESVDYTNWSNGGPDNYYNQDYVSIKWWGTSGSEWADDYSSGGWEWRNGWQWNEGYRGIVEVDLPEGAEDAGGNDDLEGGRGDDNLKGGSGNDRLDGSDAIAKGASEYDILGGGLGKDTFVLGSAAQSYYLGNGSNDYARILDFKASIDVLQLHGSAENYQSRRNGSHLELFAGDELIAVLENISELDLSDSSSITFV